MDGFVSFDFILLQYTRRLYVVKRFRCLVSFSERAILVAIYTANYLSFTQDSISYETVLSGPKLFLLHTMNTTSSSQIAS